MKKSFGFGLLVILLIGISSFIIYIITSKQKLHKEEFNIKSGEVLKFDEYDTKVTVLHIASTICKDKKKCFEEGEVEVSLRVDFNEETTNYTLKSKTHPQERIKNSNNYVILSYKDDQITIEIKNKTEM